VPAVWDWGVRHGVGLEQVAHQSVTPGEPEWSESVVADCVGKPTPVSS
jgi:hypothetical protein